jgi:hypothetical protein
MNLPAVLAVLLGQLVAGDGRGGETAQRVALFPVDSDAALYARLAAELRSQGFEPIEVSLPAADVADPFEPLTDSMRATHSERALRIESSPRSVRLWIANAATGKRIYRETASSSERTDPAIVSLWAVEALRASGVAPEPLPAPPVVTAPLAAPPPAPVSPRRFALQLGPAAVLSPGGVGPSAQLVAGLRWFVTGRAGGELLLILPAMPSRLERAAGSTEVSIGCVAAGPVVSLGDVDARWSAQLAAGAALTLVRVSGVGAADYLGETGHVVGGGPYARAGVALRLSSSLRLRADALGGAVFPQPVIYFADQRVADWGRPWLGTTLALEAFF